MFGNNFMGPYAMPNMAYNQMMMNPSIGGVRPTSGIRSLFGLGRASSGGIFSCRTERKRV